MKVIAYLDFGRYVAFCSVLRLRMLAPVHMDAPRHIHKRFLCNAQSSDATYIISCPVC